MTSPIFLRVPACRVPTTRSSNRAASARYSRQNRPTGASLIEEAAGISKFRSRQRAAESRLESAKTNLGRISDIVSEIEKQVNSLRRQAAKTRRFKILQEEFRSPSSTALCGRGQISLGPFRGTKAPAWTGCRDRGRSAGTGQRQRKRPPAKRPKRPVTRRKPRRTSQDPLKQRPRTRPGRTRAYLQIGPDRQAQQSLRDSAWRDRGERAAV